MIFTHHSCFRFITVVLAFTRAIDYKIDHQLEEFSEENGNHCYIKHTELCPYSYLQNLNVYIRFQLNIGMVQSHIYHLGGSKRMTEVS